MASYTEKELTAELKRIARLACERALDDQEVVFVLRNVRSLLKMMDEKKAHTQGENHGI